MRFFNEPRAAFYTEKRGKKQNKKCACLRGCQEILPGGFSHKCDRHQKRLEMGSRFDLKWPSRS
ncbi:FIG00731809: hypothetical protein [Klebsiella pneumoniae IS43]|uniref:Uncharacterized protein n=1 Tax=Klebsiella pneumoniae IS43 TaxID=1432552 RepID=W1DM57_KLEPN|nr:FIG00731809: hypothetical protein [Klebsiella pneumoniae IS43]